MRRVGRTRVAPGELSEEGIDRSRVKSELGPVENLGVLLQDRWGIKKPHLLGHGSATSEAGILPGFNTAETMTLVS
jgi:hypothetical protein